MNKEYLEITDEDIELLKEMKKNCLKSNIYEDEKRLLKANAITKLLVFYEENEQLQQKVNQLETNRDEAIKELFILKDMIYKPETREENFEIQRKISSILIELERGKELWK